MTTHTCKDPANCRHEQHNEPDAMIRQYQLSIQTHEGEIAKAEQKIAERRELLAQRQVVMDQLPVEDTYDIDTVLILRYGDSSFLSVRKRSVRPNAYGHHRCWRSNTGDDYTWGDVRRKIQEVGKIRELKVTKKWRTIVGPEVEGC